MTRIVIVGEMFYSDLGVGGGPIYPGAPGAPVDPSWGVGWQPGGQRPPHVGGGPVYPSRPGGPVDPGWGNQPPVDPGYGRPDWAPGHPGNRPPGSYPGGHPGNRPPGSWDGNYPSGQPIPGGERPDNSLPEVLPKGGTDVPEDVYQPAPIPEEIASQVIVSVYNPKTMTWTTKSYPPPAG